MSRTPICPYCHSVPCVPRRAIMQDAALEAGWEPGARPEILRHTATGVRASVFGSECEPQVQWESGVGTGWDRACSQTPMSPEAWSALAEILADNAAMDWEASSVLEERDRRHQAKETEVSQ